MRNSPFFRTIEEIMKNIHLPLAVLLVLSLSLSAQVNNFREDISKRGTTSAAFLEIGVGARSLAMGGAFTALANDPSAIYWNAAGIAKMNRNSFLFNHSEWIADTDFDFFAAVFPLGRMGAVGVSITSLSMSEMEVTTIEQPEGTGQFFKAGDYAVSVTYALRLTDRFAIGFNPKFIHQFIWEMQASGFAIDIGVHYQTPFKGVQLGFAMTNFGTDMRIDGDNNRVLYDLDPRSSGNNERLPARLETDPWALPLNFKIGLMYDVMKSDYHEMRIAVDAQHPNNDFESINAGAEYVWNNLLALRGGYKSMFLSDAEESFTLGAGLKYAMVGNMMFHFDYAFVEFGILENVHKFSISLDL